MGAIHLDINRPRSMILWLQLFFQSSDNYGSRGSHEGTRGASSTRSDLQLHQPAKPSPGYYHRDLNPTPSHAAVCSFAAILQYLNQTNVGKDRLQGASMSPESRTQR